MELLPGGALWALTHKVGLRISLARFYAAQMLEVLEFLHNNHVVHRDVKPENVLLTSDGHIKVIDFGTAKLLGQPSAHRMPDDPRKGQYKEFVGTAEYMAPEAIDNKYTDQRADLWSYGCFLGQLIGGMPPFKGGSDYLTFKRVQGRKFALAEGFPADAAALIDSLLQTEPAQRLGSATSEPPTRPTPLAPVQAEEVQNALYNDLVAKPDAAEAAAAAAVPPPPTVVKHADIRAHPFFAHDGCDGTDLHLRPVPMATSSELALAALCERAKEVGPTEAVSGTRESGPDAWNDEVRRCITFEFGKRELLPAEMRELLGLGPPPPPVEDDLSEFAHIGEGEADNPGTVV